MLHPQYGKTSFDDQRKQADCGVMCYKHLTPESGGEVSLAHPQPVNIWCRDKANMIDLQSTYKLYGDSLRMEAIFVKVMKSTMSKNAWMLELQAE